MKGYLTTISIVFFSFSLVSCFIKGKPKGLPDDGQLHGVAPTSRPRMGAPLNMVFVPPGTFHMGPSDEDISYNYTSRNRQVSIPGFWMDKTEITNNDYRQFVNWVRDSLAFKILFGPGINKANDTMAVDWKKVATIKYDRNTWHPITGCMVNPKLILINYLIVLNIMICVQLQTGRTPVCTKAISLSGRIRKFTPIHWCG